MPWTKKDRRRKVNIAYEGPGETYGYGKEGINPTKEKLEEVNLGADPRNPGPILISSQLSVQKEKDHFGGAPGHQFTSESC